MLGGDDLSQFGVDFAVQAVVRVQNPWPVIFLLAGFVDAGTLAESVDDARLLGLCPFEKLLRSFLVAMGVEAFESGPGVRVLPDDG